VDVFICYSRTDFYLAEDLALGLRDHGLQTWMDVLRLEPGADWQPQIEDALRASDVVLLVASRRALASPQVQAELALAHASEKPTVIAAAEGRLTLPPELSRSAFVDVRRGFERKLPLLAKALQGEPTPVTRGGPPGVVFAVAGTLSLVSLACCLIGWDMASSRYGGKGHVFVGVGTAIAGLWVFWLIAEFVRRRARRTALIVGVLVFSDVLAVAVTTALLLVTVLASEAAVAPLWLGSAGIVAGVVIAGGLWAWNSRALYRRLPTGDAPLRLRTRMRRNAAAFKAAGASSAETYSLHADELDGSVIRELERAFAPHPRLRRVDDGADVRIRVVSNLTRAAELDAELARTTGRIVLVIAAPVPETALGDFRRHQWVDHRRRRFATLERLADSLGTTGPADPDVVPESLGLRVLPFGVIASAAFFALGAISGVALAVARFTGTDPTGTLYGGVSSLPAATAGLAPMIGLPALVYAILVSRRAPWRTFVALSLLTEFTSLAATKLYWPETTNATILVSLAVGGVLLLFTWHASKGWLPEAWPAAGVERLGTFDRPWWRRSGARSLAFTTAMATGLFVVASVVSEGDPFVPSPTRVIGQAALSPPYEWTPPIGWADQTATARADSGPNVLHAFAFLDRSLTVAGAPAGAGHGDVLATNRGEFERAGLEIASRVVPASLAGERRAETFRYRGPATRGRYLAAVHGGVVYVIALSQTDRYPTSEEFERILAGWRWNE
jgi:hypothetical protein